MSIIEAHKIAIALYISSKHAYKNNQTTYVNTGMVIIDTEKEASPVLEACMLSKIICKGSALFWSEYLKLWESKHAYWCTIFIWNLYKSCKTCSSEFLKYWTIKPIVNIVQKRITKYSGIQTTYIKCKQSL